MSLVALAEYAFSRYERRQMEDDKSRGVERRKQIVCSCSASGDGGNVVLLPDIGFIDLVMHLRS